jgi:predicted secreted protein
VSSPLGSRPGQIIVAPKTSMSRSCCLSTLAVWIWVSSLAVTLTSGQDNQIASVSPVISGSVIDQATNSGVSDTHVILFQDAAGKFRGREKVAETTTDLGGHYRFDVSGLGVYYLEVKKDGYIVNSPSSKAQAVLDQLHPRCEVDIVVSGSASIAGRIVDRDSGEPLANFSLTVQTLPELGKETKTFSPYGKSATTNAQGEFLAEGLRPGSYIVKIASQHLGSGQIVTQFTDQDLEVVDRDYETSYWPGGYDLAAASGIILSSGSLVNIGTLRARTAFYYRAHISVPTEGCGDGEVWNFTFSAGPSDNTGGRVPCGKDILVRYLQPGLYTFNVVAGVTKQSRRWGTTSVSITDKDLKTSITLAPGADLDGRVVVADESGKISLDNLKVNLEQVAGFRTQEPPVSLDAQGKFRISNVAWTRHQLTITGLVGSQIVREIRYGGVPSVDNILVVREGAPSQSLVIVLDDAPATLLGRVTSDDVPVPQPCIAVARWPVPSEDLLLATKVIQGGKDGSFQIGGLAPGEYKIVAVSQTQQRFLQQKSVLERLLQSAEKVELRRMGFQNLMLKITDATR